MQMEPMNSATQDSKKKAPLTLEDIDEEMAQRLRLTRHHLQFKTRHQLNELWERKLQRTFDKVNLAALTNQRKAEADFARVRKLVTQMEITSNIQRIKCMTWIKHAKGNIVQQFRGISIHKGAKPK